MPKDLATKVLARLRENESATASQLSEEIGVDVISAVDALNHLTEAGLVAWHMGPHGFAYHLSANSAVDA